MNFPQWQLEFPPSHIARPREIRAQTLTLQSVPVNDVPMQIAKQMDGNYQGSDYFSLP